MDDSVFEHDGPWTEDAYLALPHDGRVEVVDGTLLIGPGAGPHRACVVERLRAAVTAALPDSLRVRGPVPLRLGPDCVLVPDLVVVAAPVAPAAGDTDDAEDAEPVPSGDEEQDGEQILDAAAALMVLEVVGRDHGAADRTFKPQLYARSRIPYSLLLDHDVPFAVADMIIGGRYHEYAYARGEERLLIEEPFRLELDLAAVTAPEAGAEPAADEAAPTDSAADERTESPAQALAQTPAEA